MDRFRKHFESTYSYLKEKGVHKASIGLILGTGMDSVVSIITKNKSVPYAEIPCFPQSNVNFHKGQLVWGEIANKKVLCMKGRYHHYEGYSLREVCYPVYALYKLGVRQLIITSAVGGICKDYAKGDLLLVKDHINLSSANPLIGMRGEKGEIIFPNMLDAYDEKGRQMLKRLGMERGIDLKEGVLAYLPGPNFETRAELQSLSSMGADMIGWSMVPEVLMSRALNIRTIGICCVSDISNPATAVPADLNEIISVCNKASSRIATLVQHAVGELN